MEPFKVECVDDSPHQGGCKDELLRYHQFTVIDVSVSPNAVFYRIKEIDGSIWWWNASRFKAIEEVSKPNKQGWGEKYHLVIECIHDLNIANNLVVALTKHFVNRHFDIEHYYQAESGQEYSVVENPPSISGTLRKRMKTFCEGFLAAMP